MDDRRGGRVAEGARLERVYTGNRIEGSNPSLSATSKSSSEPAAGDFQLLDFGEFRPNGAIKVEDFGNVEFPENLVS